ncbi:non-functional NADPH-dependent codeinone reductase 2-like [Malania oleifera]|uniref:non-functional NADPH-dependent codeinone reductase 2-like n=1 Tax=Malania oleifera TaxID=397392 RepID=UPI0025AE80C4|nr:non-functional NADPH-dependent codeinone reductase 2-like [Malania oleifera]
MECSSEIIPVTHLSVSQTAKSIPLVGFGTAEYPFAASDVKVKQSILQAIEVGYRHFDTAALYLSEKPLGDAVAQALSLGLIQSRHDLFITSKLWCADAHSDCVLPALRNSLKNLGMEYIDLFLIHWPVSLKPGKQGVPMTKEDLLPMDLGSVWAAMEECQELGLAKSIGVSNFTCKKLEELLSFARIPPAVNQVEMNPAWQQKKLREYCEAKGIHITAFSPLGAKGKPWGNQVVDNQVLAGIAEHKGKSVAQVCLRWVHEQGVSLVVKSFNEERMKENLKIFDWELSPEELEKINQIPQHRGTLGEGFVSENGPYKTLMELWDGET